MTIKNFSIEYDAINSRNTFTNGDTINGRIIMEVSKETKVQSLVFIAQGKARVRWTEHYGQHHTHVYWADEKYYDVKQHILRETRQDGTEIIGKGRHVFPFSFQIPDRKIPSSFKSTIGKIVHKVKAELKQSMKLTKKTKTHFTFVSKADRDIPGLLDPQYGSKDKSVKVFGSGNISLDIQTKRMGYKQGNKEEQFMKFKIMFDNTLLHPKLLGSKVKVTADISNQSSRSVKPKFILYEKQSFFAQGRRRLSTNEILKEKAEAVEPTRKETVTKVITIPRELPPSILNCSIIKLEYRLKVILDVKLATDPKIKLPIVVLPEHPDEKQLPPSAGIGFQTFENQNQAAWNMVPQPQATLGYLEPPPPYGAYPNYPSSANYSK